jgi:hypothetical protein
LSAECMGDSGLHMSSLADELLVRALRGMALEWLRAAEAERAALAEQMVRALLIGARAEFATE